MSSGLSEQVANLTYRQHINLHPLGLNRKVIDSPTSIGNVAMVDLVDVDVVNVNVGVLVHVDIVAQVVRCQPVNLMNLETD